MIVYIVTDSTGYVQAYSTKTSAHGDIIEALIDRAKDFGYSEEELAAAIQELDEDFADGRVHCGTYLGEYEISCTESTVED